MKQGLIILSDLWGWKMADWIKSYLKFLATEFEIKLYDCCELGKIDLANYNELRLHDQFVHGGINIAVKELLNKEKKKVDVLAFSIGGTIAWKANLQGLNVRKFYAASSTRLRDETIQLNGACP